MQRVLVFTRTKHGADKVVRNLARARIEAAAIHGNKSQGQRERALAAFKNGGTRVLVATDIAARGLHIEAVTHVVNYDLPNIPESYVHRIGRTARAGAAGIALSFCNGEERAFLRDIEKLTRMSIPVAALPEGISAGVLAEESEKRPARRGRNQSRRNEQPRGEKRASGKPGQKHGRGGERSGERNGNRSQGNGNGNGRGERRERSAGLDPASGLPAFLTRPQRRPDSERRVEV
jgi:ATP-dependent RNA helicase RhlE